MKIDFTSVFCVVLIVIVFAIIAILIFGAFVNWKNKIDEGVIVDINFTRGSTNFHSDKYGVHMYSTQDTYTFTIEGKKNGKTVRYTFNVTEEDYNHYKIGDWYER